MGCRGLFTAGSTTGDQNKEQQKENKRSEDQEISKAGN
jgi:hypothetical protein